MSDFDFDYQRVIIRGSLTTESPLHIGSGDCEQLDKDFTPDDKHYQLANTILSDHNGQPYIPASTLRGFLRDSCVQAGLSISTLFGEARQTPDDEHSGSMGKLRVYDCCAKPDTSSSTVMMRTAISPVTATALQHSLNSHHVVETGTVFEVELALDHCHRDDVETLLAALACINGEASRIGKGKSVGQGKLNWQVKHVKTLTTADYKNWLQDGASSSRPEFTGTDFDDVSDKPLAINRWEALPLSLQSLSPLLINDPQLVTADEARAQSDAADKEKYTPDLIFSGEALVNGKPCRKTLVAQLKRWVAEKEQSAAPQGSEADEVKIEAVIPASTFKGWLRSHCRRILLTIAGGAHAADLADAYLRQLFGGTDEGTGFFRFSDIKAPLTAQGCHPQTFNAVDRFTGGVKPSALYEVIAVSPDKAFMGALFFCATKNNGQAMTEGMKLLLLFAIRDAMEGDLVLGWGKSKGYGQLQLTLIDYPDWQSFQEDSSLRCDAEAGFKELQQELGMISAQQENAA